MSPIDELVPLLKKLRLSGVLESLELRTSQAAEGNMAHAEFLLRILADEVERRDAKHLEDRVRKANFEHAKTLEDFDFLFNPRIPKARVVDLATCLFVTQKRNVLLVGPSGVGKSHIAQALGHRACLAGHKVLYVVASDMFRQLRAARGDGTHERKLMRFTSPNLLIIDDLGLKVLNEDESTDLYELIRVRYERGSIIITSNRALEELPTIFSDQLLASAATDRLLDDAKIIVIEGDSFRNPANTKSPARKKLQPQHKGKQEHDTHT